MHTTFSWNAQNSQANSNIGEQWHKCDEFKSSNNLQLAVQGSKPIMFNPVCGGDGHLNGNVSPAISKTPTSAPAAFRSISQTSRTASCQICYDIFSNKSALNRHMNTVHKQQGDRTFDCTICDKTFSRRDTLQRHISIHDKSGYRTCLGCNKKFRPDFLQYHLRATTNSLCLQAFRHSLTTNTSVLGANESGDRYPARERVGVHQGAILVPSADITPPSKAPLSTENTLFLDTASQTFNTQQHGDWYSTPSHVGVSESTRGHKTPWMDCLSTPESYSGDANVENGHMLSSTSSHMMSTNAFEELGLQPQDPENIAVYLDVLYDQTGWLPDSRIRVEESRLALERFQSALQAEFSMNLGRY